MQKRTKQMILSAMMLALCLLLPFLTGQIPSVGKALSPMHIPVFLCGFLCGWPWALIVGFIAPPLRFFLFGMPPIFPTGLAMAFELAAYGAATSLLSRKIRGGVAATYAVLISSMLIGRVVWGVVSLILYGLDGSAFTLSAFIAGAFANAVPGIICHLVVIPPLVHAVRKLHWIED